MASDRTYSTREIAQMWNVSESTVKRWADSFGLRCYRTPGGHRRFRLEDIYEFQQQRSFEATGLLSTDEWEDPDLEIWLNTRNYEKIRELLVYLASHNQGSTVRGLLERLYLRGMRLDEIYDEIIVPVFKSTQEATQRGELTEGQRLLVRTNIEVALTHLGNQMIHRRSNGKTALCASPTHDSRIAVSTMARVLEIEGWESLNLGDDVPFRVISEIVEQEPVNMVCLFVCSCVNEVVATQDCEGLVSISHKFRIPVLLSLDSALNCSPFPCLEADREIRSLRKLREAASDYSN